LPCRHGLRRWRSRWRVRVAHGSHSTAVTRDSGGASVARRRAKSSRRQGSLHSASTPWASFSHPAVEIQLACQPPDEGPVGPRPAPWPRHAQAQARDGRGREDGVHGVAAGMFQAQVQAAPQPSPAMPRVRRERASRRAAHQSSRRRSPLPWWRTHAAPGWTGDAARMATQRSTSIVEVRQEVALVEEHMMVGRGEHVRGLLEGLVCPFPSSRELPPYLVRSPRSNAAGQTRLPDVFSDHHQRSPAPVASCSARARP